MQTTQLVSLKKSYHNISHVTIQHEIRWRKLAICCCAIIGYQYMTELFKILTSKCVQPYLLSGLPKTTWDTCQC